MLLQAVLDLFAQGKCSANRTELSPELSELFTLYWQKIRPPRQRGVITYPFVPFQFLVRHIWNARSDYSASSRVDRAKADALTGVRMFVDA